MPTTSTTTTAQTDWALIHQRYIQSNLDGPQFAASEGVDYGRLRWHVAHHHWVKDRRAFLEESYARAKELALQDAAERLKVQFHAVPRHTAPYFECR